MDRLSTARLPPSPYLHRIVIRSGVAWAALRLPFAFLPSPDRGLTVGASVLLVAIAVWLTMRFARLRNEHLILANLGIGSVSRTALAGVVPVLGEIAVRLFP